MVVWNKCVSCLTTASHNAVRGSSCTLMNQTSNINRKHLFPSQSRLWRLTVADKLEVSSRKWTIKKEGSGWRKEGKRRGGTGITMWCEDWKTVREREGGRDDLTSGPEAWARGRLWQDGKRETCARAIGENSPHTFSNSCVFCVCVGYCKNTSGEGLLSSIMVAILSVLSAGLLH